MRACYLSMAMVIAFFSSIEYLQAVHTEKFDGTPVSENKNHLTSILKLRSIQKVNSSCSDGITCGQIISNSSNEKAQTDVYLSPNTWSNIQLAAASAAAAAAVVTVLLTIVYMLQDSLQDVLQDFCCENLLDAIVRRIGIDG